MPLQNSNNKLFADNGALVLTDECCDCGDCILPFKWRIVDADNNVYANGDVLRLADPANPVGVLTNFPNPWFPFFYWTGGGSMPITLQMRLQVFGCGFDWETIEEWPATIDTCAGGRYPEQYFSGSWSPPGNCGCSNYSAVNAGAAACVPCPPLVAGRTGNGQPFLNGFARVFTGAQDGEWTNLLNWEDGLGNSPAIAPPGPNSIVTIIGSATSAALPITVREITVASGGLLSVPVTTTDLYVVNGGVVGNAPLCPCEQADPNEPVPCVEITVNRLAVFYDTATMQSNKLNGDAIFTGNSSNENGIVTGNAIFNDDAFNNIGGIIKGNATFNSRAYNNALVEGNATFNGLAYNLSQVNGAATFKGNSENAPSGVVDANATFNGNAVNSGYVTGTAAFNETASNGGTVELDATFDGRASNGSVYGSGRVNGNATFNGASTNGLLPNDGTVGGDATFNDTSIHVTGTVAGNATFNDNTINRANVTNTATFNDNACNWVEDGFGGTAGAFVPNPPPEC
jgi:hypothetical protein